MKRISAMILGLFIGLNSLAQYRCVLGTDIAAVMKAGGINISAGSRIAARWSVSCRAEISLDPVSPDEDMEYDEHRGEFVELHQRDKILRNTRAGLEYWPAGTFQGACLGAGIRSTQDTEADCYMGIGYCIPIWKGFCAIMSYCTDTGLGLGLYWAIGKQS